MSDELISSAQAASRHEQSTDQSKPSHPPFPKDEQIVRMLIVMNDALYAIDADPRIEHHRNAQNLFYSCKEWFQLHGIGIKKDVRANMYQFDASGYGIPQAAPPAGPHDLAGEQGQEGAGMTREQQEDLERAQRWYCVTREKLNLLPDRPHRALVQAQHVLDVGCGEGLWVTEQAKMRPYSNCIGLDINPRKIDMAAMLATQERTRNAMFFVDDMNRLNPYKLPDEAFGFIHLCNVAEGLLKTDYQALAKRLFRLAQPGGFIAWTEAEFPVTTSRALDAIIFHLCAAIEQSGHTFHTGPSCSPSPELLPCYRRTLQIQAWLGFWLTEAGFAELDEFAHMLVVSYGQPAHAAFVEQVDYTLARIRPFLIRSGVLTDKKIEALFSDALQEIQHPSFGGMLYIKTACARKPDPSAPQTLKAEATVSVPLHVSTPAQEAASC